MAGVAGFVQSIPGNVVRTTLPSTVTQATVNSAVTNSVQEGLSSDIASSEIDPVSLVDYLRSIATNQGLENERNRQFNSAEAKANREFQSSEAQKQRDWYEAMSSTAYQRAMKDMKSAGLNPILAYQQGGAAASGTGVPTGSAASYGVTGGDTISSLMASAADLIAAFTGSASRIASALILKK